MRKGLVVRRSNTVSSRLLGGGRQGGSASLLRLPRRSIITDNQPIRTHAQEEVASSNGSSGVIKRILAIGVGAGLVVTALTLPLADEITNREEVRHFVLLSRAAQLVLDFGCRVVLWACNR